MSEKEYEECDNCGRLIAKGYMNQHKGSITCEAEGKIKSLSKNGYVRVNHPTYLNKLKKENKTTVAPTRQKRIHKGDHYEYFYKLGHWVKREDFKEVKEKYIRDYKDRPRTNKLYENENYVLCDVDNGTLFKKIEDKRGKVTRRRKFRYSYNFNYSLKRGNRKRTNLYTLKGEKFAEEIEEGEKENIEDKKLINRYVTARL